MDLSSKSAIIKLVLPHVPYLMRTALAHTLYLSSTSNKWDLRTEIAVKLLRAILAAPSPHGALHRQQVTVKDPGIKGKIWISKALLPAPTDDKVLSGFCHLVDDLRTHPDDVFTRPDLLPVEAEWTGYRPGAHADQARPDLSEAQHFERLIADTKTHITILYFHGGAFVMMDPCSHRNGVSNLCRLTGGKALSIRYRLAPQNPFPAALLDAYIAYLSLLYPAPGSLHKPIQPESIVFAGDSAGGSLCMSLTLLLLQLNSRTPAGSEFRFHEHEIKFPLPLPAGVAPVSPWLDLTHSFPSWIENEKYDYLPGQSGGEWLEELPPDSIWPADPPRGDLYCDTTMLCHQLASTAACPDWTGAPPLWFAYGEEMLVDEGKQVAQQAAKDGVTVIWESWEGMCHCFGMVLWGSPLFTHFFNDWARFCRAVCGVDNNAVQTDPQDHKHDHLAPMKLETKGTFFEAKTNKPIDVDVHSLAVLSHEEAMERMGKAMDKRHRTTREAVNVLPKL